ncbi:MAG: AzlC family ABC transporter permease [Spirochaetales bacterium]|nr:AzlC family ABC transporter permease [Spirochaetales bacterium]
MNRSSEFFAGAKATIPLILGAVPFGLMFGAVAVNAGITPFGTVAMSLFVFAGSGQFIAAGLVSQGIQTGFIILTTFVVNLRHALYAASLAPYMRRLPQRWLLPLGFWLTDETYAVVIKRWSRGDESPYPHWYHLGSSVAMYLNWQLCTILGVLAGRAIPDASGWGLNFAMVATFIGIVVPMITTRAMLLAALTAGATALLFNDLPNKIGLMIAAIAGITVGYLADTVKTARAGAKNSEGEE